MDHDRRAAIARPEGASEEAPSETAGPAPVVAAVPTGSPARKRDDRQCQCCASPLGEPIQLEHTKRILCTQCLGFMARWIIELEQGNKVDNTSRTP